MDITRAGEGLTGQDGGSGSRGSSFYRLTNGFPTLASYARPRDPQGSLGTPVAHEVRHFLRNQYVRAYQSYPHNLKVAGSNPTPATNRSIAFGPFRPRGASGFRTIWGHVGADLCHLAELALGSSGRYELDRSHRQP